MCTTSSSSSPSADLTVGKVESWNRKEEELLFFKGIRAMIQGEGDQQLILRVSPQHWFDKLCLIYMAYTSQLTPCTEPGRSKAGVSEILMASLMAASKPFPPSPLRAGPKHSGRRMSSLTTTLEFSSTLSPGTQIMEHKYDFLVCTQKKIIINLF